MKKKLWVLVAVLALFVFVFSACNGGNYPFNKLSDIPTGEAVSNGGAYVEKGEWSYFVNGVEQHTAENKWSKTENRIGMLVRVKTADLGKEDADIQMVVPLLVFSNNKATFGFWIFGDKIYYSTPNSEKNANGVVQNQKLDIMSVNLDGTGTKRLHTFDDNSTDFMYVQKSGGGVYVVYINADQELHAIDTDKSRDKDKLITEDIASYKFDRKLQEVYYVQKQLENKGEDNETELNYNILFKYKAGSDPTQIRTGKNDDPIANKDHQLMTLVYVENGVMWLTLQNKHINGNDDLGLWKCSNASDLVRISANSYTNFVPYVEGGNNVLLVYEDSRGISKYTFDANGRVFDAFLHPDKTALLYGATGGEGTVVLEHFSSDKKFLYYSTSGALYRLEVGKGYQEPVRISDPDSVAAVEWMPLEIIEKSADVVWVIYNASGIEDGRTEYMFRTVYDNTEADDDDKRTTVCISKIIEDEE